MKKSEAKVVPIGAFVTEVTVAPEDIDGLGHANNGRYVAWCEQAAWAHSKAAGLSLEDYQRIDRAMAVRQATYDYILPSYAGDRLVIHTWLEDTQSLKMTRQFVIRKAGEINDILRARWLLVCIEISTGKPKRLPAEFASRYSV